MNALRRNLGPALGRLARGYEADSEKRRDLLQEIHLALWRSFKGLMGVVHSVPGYTAWRITPELPG